MNKRLIKRKDTDVCGRMRPGFAIIVTVSILVLLAVVAVGLLTLSTVTVRAAGQSNAREVARANARLAMILAIGDLQKTTGPDQRVTATADIAAGSDGEEVDAGVDPANSVGLDGVAKGLSKVFPGTRHWTGAFKNGDDPASIYKKTPTANLEQWLVSGQQVGGNINPSLESCAVGVNGKVSDDSVAAVLVGRHTVGTGGTSQNDYVAAPIVPVEMDAGAGLDGAFAYWVGDEGVKARINMERSNEDPESYASLVAQRRGWETVTGFETYPPATADVDSSLPGLMTVPSAELLIDTLGNGNPSPSQSVFHSATAASRGLLVDTLEGGTRVDLTAALANGLPAAAPVDAYDNFPKTGGRIIPASASSRLSRLRWDHLETFYNRHSELDGGVLKVAERTNATTASIAPIITDFRILMGVRLEADSSGGQATGQYKVNPCGKFAVSIANPYSVPLEWDTDLEFEIKNISPAGNRPSRIWQIKETCIYIPSGGTADRAGREGAVFNQAVFRIKPDRLEPGEARAYTQAGKVTRQRASSNRLQFVDLEEFGKAAPWNFNHCIEMVTGTKISLPKTMDVREGWQTTLVNLEMRAGGRGRGFEWLRRVERVELDNGYFGPNQRTFRGATTGGPVPMMLYSFQVSQPGMDYLSLMPRDYELGQRSSTLRTFADFNLRASTVHKPIASYNPPPYFMESNDSFGQLGPISPGGETGGGFTRNLALPSLYWGRSSQTGSSKTVLYSVPRQFTSLAQLQHADLTADDRSISVSHQPGNAFGNSYATPFVKRSLVEQRRVDYELIGERNHSGATQRSNNYYDISHLLNTSLWDRYFFSTVPTGGTSAENPTLVSVLGGEPVDFSNPGEAAAGLMIEGAFNINSTDQKAWKVFLASSKYFTHSADGEFVEAAFPRSLEQPSAHQLPPSGDEDDSFSGYRRLTDKELDDLATEIVKQVRLRGPFVSLSHFVNRALADINDESRMTRSGALQFALDESGINISHDGNKSGFDNISVGEDRVTLAAKERAPRADLDGRDRGDRPRDANRRNPDWAMTSRDNNFGAVASILADREMLLDYNYKDEQGWRSTGIPGWVTQADVLQVIGPSISARSDTFRVRSMGEARDATGKVLATAYCEAIVQRMPGYIDPEKNRAIDRAGDLTTINTKFGRRFEIVSFRWLSSNEI